VEYRLEATRVTADADAEMVVPHSLDLTCKTTTLETTAQSLGVSVLDLAATRAGEGPGNAIARSVELARHVEQRASVHARAIEYEISRFHSSPTWMLPVLWSARGRTPMDSGKEIA
jgi:hypothetical protein